MGTTPQEITELDAGGHPVLLGAAVLHTLEKQLQPLKGVMPLVLGDHNTLQHCLPELLAHVPSLRGAATIAVEPGEGAKSLEVCQVIWNHLLDLAADRQALLVNLGGGVVTDLGGFVAATYKRGIRSINVPTTLMGMVDAAIGGKTGIDLAGVKNVIGAFHPPLGVYVHVPFLRTLGKRELLNGLAEMLKHGLVADAEHFEQIANAALHDLDALAPLIQRSAAIKAAVVRDDPRESGLRKVLNFGHSIGHGIEAHAWEGQGRALLHGEAIAIGMVAEAWLSWRMELLDREQCDRIAEVLLKLYPAHHLESSDNHRILELMRNDKKNADGGFRFTLLNAIGSARYDVPVTAAQVQEALEHYRLLVRK